VKRWLKHWRSLPRRNRVGAALCLVALIVILIVLMFQIGDLVASLATQLRRPPQPSRQLSMPHRMTQASYHIARGGNHS
jgi:hypothetical protein